MFTRVLDFTCGTLGSVCIATTIADTAAGSTLQWWAQFGAAITVCVGVIYLMIKYLIPKLDTILASQLATQSLLKDIQEDNKQISLKQLEFENRLLNFLENTHKEVK